MHLHRSALLACAAAALLFACGDDTPAGADTADAADTLETSDSADVSEDGAVAADTEGPPACNPITQTGCEPTQNCTFDGDDRSPSCTTEGTAAYGAECSGGVACARGVCMSLNDTGYRCYKFCQTLAHCDADAACLALTGVPYKVCEIKNLYDSCDLLLQDCADAKGCYIIANEPTPVCLPPGTAAPGDTCTDAAACAPGNICINQRCKRTCDPQQTDPCGNFIPCSSYPPAGYCDE